MLVDVEMGTGASFLNISGSLARTPSADWSIGVQGTAGSSEDSLTCAVEFSQQASIETYCVPALSEGQGQQRKAKSGPAPRKPPSSWDEQPANGHGQAGGRAARR